MKTILDSAYEAPDFDVKIAEWLSSYIPSEYDFEDIPRRVGILFRRDGVSAVYRAIDGNGIVQIGKVCSMLESIGLRDLEICTNQRFSCIYGFADHRPAPGDKYHVLVLG